MKFMSWPTSPLVLGLAGILAGAYYLPNADCMNKSSAVLKEHIGYWAYRGYLLVKSDPR